MLAFASFNKKKFFLDYSWIYFAFPDGLQRACGEQRPLSVLGRDHAGVRGRRGLFLPGRGADGVY